MKFSLILSAAALVAFSFSSCKKDYTCECKWDDSDQTTEYEYKNVKKKDAEEACESSNSVSGFTCELK